MQESMLQRGIYYDHDDNMSQSGSCFGQPWKPEQKCDGCNKVSEQINQSMQYLNAGLGEVIRIVDSAMRKKRRAVVCRRLIQISDGRIGLLIRYDNEEEEAVEFFTNLRGEMHVYRLAFQEYDLKKSLFGIHFPAESIWVFGDVQRVNGAYLYQRFISSGISFSPNQRDTIIRQVLMETFSTFISQTEDELKVPVLPGWDGKKYRCKENFPVRFLRDIVDLPIMEKTFQYGELTSEVQARYFEFLNSIVNNRDRLLIALYPFMGMLNSFLKREAIEIPFFLNFVQVNPVPVRNICEWFQIFNRRYLAPLDSDVADKKLWNLLASVKDEVVIFSCCPNSEDTTYRKEKLHRQMYRIGDIAVGRNELPVSCKHTFQAVYVAISDIMALGHGAVNIVLDDMFMNRTKNISHSIYSDIFGPIFQQFITFVEKNNDELRKIISSRRKMNDSSAKVTACMYDLVSMFWQTYGVNFGYEAGLSREIDFVTLFEDTYHDKEAIITLFVQVVRRQAKELVFRVKENCKEGGENLVVYSEEYLWFPCCVMQNIFKSSGLNGDKHQILLTLREQGSLKTDSEGLTRKLQIKGVRREYYQIKRKLFNQIGLIDIVMLGKEN